MRNIKSNFDKVLHTIKSLNLTDFYKDGNICKPGITDIEVISPAIVAEYMSSDSENWLFKKIYNDYKEQFPHIIDSSRYNRRKRQLFPFIEEIRQHMSTKFLEYEEYFIIDSMPFEECKISREKRSQVCSERFETAPYKEYCVSQNQYFYEYKLQGVCSINGVFHSIEYN